MLGRNPPTMRCSTLLMKRPINVLFMCVDEKKKWKVQTLKQMQDTVAEVLCSRMPEQKADTESCGSPACPSQQHSHITPSQSLHLTSEKTNTSPGEAAGKSIVSSETKPSDTVQSEAGLNLDSLLHSSEVDEEFVSSLTVPLPPPSPFSD